jgi:predicted phage replisome organizer
MGENKRYYWLKLQENFFEDDTIDFIEGQENGEKYVLFYLKLCLKALKNEGKLIRYVGEMLLPYDDVGIAKLTRTDIDVVRSALLLFSRIGLIKKMDSGEIYLTQLNEMVGTETQKAKYMRQRRLEQKSNIVTPLLPECYTDIDTDIELKTDTDIDTDTEKKGVKQSLPPKHKNGTYQNVLLSDKEIAKLNEELGTEKAKAVIDNFSELKEMKGYKYKSDYLAIKKWGIEAYNKNCKPVHKEQYTDEEYKAGSMDPDKESF